jgi:hypothetical protein
MSAPEKPGAAGGATPAATPLSARRILLIRALFVLVTLLFVASYQWRESGRGDWYPTPLMPRFAGAPADAEGRFHFHRTEFHFEFDDGSSVELSPRQLLPSISPAQAQNIVRYGFVDFPPRPPMSDDPPPSPTIGRWLENRILPGYGQFHRRREHWGGIDPRSVAWLREEMRRRYPGRRAVRLVVRVHMDVMTRRDAIARRTLLYEAEVPW